LNALNPAAKASIIEAFLFDKNVLMHNHDHDFKILADGAGEGRADVHGVIAESVPNPTLRAVFAHNQTFPGELGEAAPTQYNIARVSLDVVTALARATQDGLGRDRRYAHGSLYPYAQGHGDNPAARIDRKRVSFVRVQFSRAVA
jgi:hypothetical protein